MADLSVALNSQCSPQELVRQALLQFRPGAVISTGLTIALVRESDLNCTATDDDLVNLVIAAAAGHSMTIEFDHNEAAA